MESQPYIPEFRNNPENLPRYFSAQQEQSGRRLHCLHHVHGWNNLGLFYRMSASKSWIVVYYNILFDLLQVLRFEYLNFRILEFF